MNSIMKLMHKRANAVQNYMYQYGYVTGAEYKDNNDNYIVEFHCVTAGVTIKSVRITFNSKWRVIDIKNY